MRRERITNGTLVPQHGSTRLADGSRFFAAGLHDLVLATGCVLTIALAVALIPAQAAEGSKTFPTFRGGLIERGEYLAHAGDCMACPTAVAPDKGVAVGPMTLTVHSLAKLRDDERLDWNARAPQLGRFSLMVHRQMTQSESIAGLR